MKTILVSTDFSQAADNAISYAAEIAKAAKAKIILFHAFHVPVVTTDAAFVMPALDEVEKNCIDGLKKIEHKLHLQYGKDLVIQSMCKCGFAVEEINNYTAEHKVDLIVTGMQGAGYLAEKLIGSVSTDLFNRSECPVLAIDKDVKYRSIKKIAFACDYFDTENKKILEPLKEFAKLFNSHVYVLTVVSEPEPIPSPSALASDFIKLEHSLGNVEHTFHYLKSDKIVEGINEFVTERKMDMVVMIPRKHTLLKNIFSEPNTKKMAFHSKVPLLALH